MTDTTNHPADPPIGVVTTVMHDTTDLEAAVAFWTALLGLEVIHEAPSYAYLGPLRENGPHLAFQEVAEPHKEKNRLHLDVRVPNRVEFIQRVVALGGGIVGDHQEGDFPTWTVMTDPEGNQFCIYEAPQQSGGEQGGDDQSDEA